ncbi:hypothetical protein HEK616_76280 (plasmid) [Streptomyces nigrescens]|uniref:HTH araC/xylS-type domain-containing protein n=2 Tax=Streptomyces TaxID=1883 RepID=A0ABN6RB84_STRNI|nr:helix-turn-helix domain-containing protein [Streptomyces nigrescens]MEE4419135.1 helix-turn-helix domain-containing protein [Streptomyces sp. DSM 41528]BDM74141.1 hypothetical protein HEK616_76280 [Streptomyces nigrescens]
MSSSPCTIDRRRTFIVERLGDPELGPEVIAAAHQISLRYLHRVFQQQATTPMAFIRQQRLDRCRRDLVNAALSHLTIHAIATRWGYPQAGPLLPRLPDGGGDVAERVPGGPADGSGGG